jgi:hypothetical protein
MLRATCALRHNAVPRMSAAKILSRMAFDRAQLEICICKLDGDVTFSIDIEDKNPSSREGSVE